MNDRNIVFETQDQVEAGGQKTNRKNQREKIDVKPRKKLGE